MTLGKIDQCIRSLRDELQRGRSGPVHKVRVKQLEVAIKVRALNYSDARLLESRRLTQAAAATALSINQPKISALKHYKLEGFSVERLMTFLTALGSDIEIRVHLPKRSSSPGRILVNAA